MKTFCGMWYSLAMTTRSLLTSICFALLIGPMMHPAQSAAQQGRPATTAPVASYSEAPAPLLSVGSLSFLEGTWTAESKDGKTHLGTYSWQRELNGHVLARHGSDAAACVANASPVCGHNDLLYVFQDSAGAPLRAIFFDNEGHVIRYEIDIRHEELPSGLGRRDFAFFLSDPAALGPRYRLSYERNTDLQTGRTTLSGRFEVLLANNEWRTYMEWFGKKA